MRSKILSSNTQIIVNKVPVIVVNAKAYTKSLIHILKQFLYFRDFIP